MTNPLHFVQFESSIRTENEIVPTALFHGLNEFYHAFLADHDSHGCVVVTHIFLILGCAFPLWYYLMLHDMFEMQPILPFVGIISLGVGDSIGAIIGVYMGRNFWPGSKRTLEGSLGMFLSTLASMIGFQGWMHQDVPHFKLLSISLAITLLEACTCHIDNLYLPLMSIGFIIME
jgi:dolichol kinase